MAYNLAIGQTEGSDLVPQEMAQKIIETLPRQSAVIAAVQANGNYMQMGSKTSILPVLSGKPIVSWVSSGGLIQTSNASWEGLTLTAETLSTIIPISKDIIDDAAFDVEAILVPQLTEAIANAIDGTVLFGTSKPTSFPNGLVSDAITKGKKLQAASVVGQDLGGDINAVMSLVEDDGYTVNGFAASTTVKGKLRNLRDENGGLIYSPSMVAGTPSTLWGEPIAYVPNNVWDKTTAWLVAGDWSNIAIAVRQDMQIERLDQAVISDADGKVITNLAQQNMVALKLTFRAAYQQAAPATGIASAYPFAVITPAA